MPTLSEAARVTVKHGTVWRTCAGCGQYRATNSTDSRYVTCTAAAHRPVPQPTDFTTSDVADIAYAGCIFAAALADVAHHHIGDPGSWDCYGTGPDEAARLRLVLDQMAAAIQTARRELTAVERRARRRAARRTRQTDQERG